MVALTLAGVLLASNAASAAKDASSSLKAPVDLTAEHLDNPLGIDTARPRLSWILHSDGRGVRQTAYQVVVSSSAARAAAAKGDVWDSGKVASGDSYEVAYAGPALDSRRRYFWRVRVWDTAGRPSDWSATAWFETALLDRNTWTADWIGKDTGAATTPEPLLRKEFALAKKIASARVYISGLAYYKLFVNGQRIGDHELDPGFTDYDHTVLYVTHDVTKELRTGTNAIGVSLGRGYYAAAGPTGGCPRWCDQPKLTLELDVRYADGSADHLTSDGTWKVANGPTARDSISSEAYDARLEQPGWTQPGFDDSAWSSALVVTAPKGRLRAQSNEPIKVTDTLEPVAETEPKPGVKVYDFGAVTAGRARITFDGAPGTTVSIRYSEKRVKDGTAESEGGQNDTYILKGSGPETYEPSYGYRGYQYVQVSATPLPKILSIDGQEMHSSVPSTGDFHSSSLLLNRYQEAMRRTILNNLHSIPTDTPVYEKLGYGGDGHLYGESAIRNFGMAAFYDKWMLDFGDAQLPDGMIPITVPDGSSNTKDDPVWSVAEVFIHDYLFTNYGDVAILRRDYPTMKKWMDLYAGRLAASNYIYDGSTYGDWTGCVVSCSVPPIEQGPPSQNAAGNSAFAGLIGTAFLYRASREMAEIARTIGEDADAEQYSAVADKVATAFQDRFYNPVTQTYGDVAGWYSQTSNLLALSFGLAPADVREAVAANLAADVSSRGDHLNTGAAGTKLILPALTDAGYPELAYRVATNPTYPGWGSWFLSCGATTMWENWVDCSDSLKRGGNPITGSTSPRSMDHAFFGTVDDWLFTHVAGIEPAAPGFRRIQFKPYPMGDLTSASAHEATPLGRVSTSWTRSDHSFTLEVTVPVGATATVYVPARDAGTVTESGAAATDAVGVTSVGTREDYAVFEIRSGTYKFESRT